jgi:TolA-binding protein
MTKSISALLLILVLAAPSRADEGILLQRIIALEKHIAELETKLAPVLEEERVKEVVKQQRAFAHERMMVDADLYQRYDLQIIEKLYQTAKQDWKAEDAKRAVTLLIEKYPRANRTGCATLTLAQSIEGDEQKELLDKAIGPLGNCYYANGVQVGPYALLYLAMRNKADGNDEKAAKLFEELRSGFPDAIDHQGQLLTEHLEGME